MGSVVFMCALASGREGDSGGSLGGGEEGVWEAVGRVNFASHANETEIDNLPLTPPKLFPNLFRTSSLLPNPSRTLPEPPPKVRLPTFVLSTQKFGFVRYMVSCCKAQQRGVNLCLGTWIFP